MSDWETFTVLGAALLGGLGLGFLGGFLWGRR